MKLFYQGRKLRFFVAVLALSLLAGCQNSQPTLTQESLGPVPEDRTTILSHLKRYRGQTEFLNPVQSFARVMGAPPSAANRESGGSARQEQESDIYKLGKPGSNLLFLLNNYRGLQVISFKDGADQARLIGRVPSTGNYPQDMYYDSARDRLLALETTWDSNYLNSQTRVVVYDVSNPENPRVRHTVSLSGNLMDSRIVGDVLYVATTTYSTNSGAGFAQNQTSKGVVYSLNLQTEDLDKVDEYGLALPAVYGSLMNIQTVTQNGQTKYYLVAVTAEHGWSWWGRQSLVEVVDISDEKGKIQPVMMVSAKGMIRERSQTHIRNQTLIVTSNYFVESNTPNVRRTARVSVETFNLPDEKSELISESEALYRKLHIERALAKVSEEQREALREKLLGDTELGLKHRFVRVDNKFRKVVPDNVVTVGDTTGLSADLQDVRYQNGLLYVFWVPANQIDPMDLFDISAPEKGVRYLSRLQFDGWISKSIPVAYKGRNFVIGLGWVVPAVNNEQNRRHPQAMIFEVVQEGSKYRAVERAQLNFLGSDVWTNFNSPDKEIEVRFKDESTGQILFAAHRYSNRKYEDGGQVIEFDLRTLVGEAGETPLKEGAFLVGPSGWLRRVFTNPELDRVHTFSDMALGTFPRAFSDIVRATQILELARNIVAYETLKLESTVRGVQIISETQWPEPGVTKLRVVRADHADAEQPQAISESKIQGAYASHLVDLSGALLVLTTEYRTKKAPNGTFQGERVNRLSRVILSAQGVLSLEDPIEWIVDQNFAQANRISGLYYAESGAGGLIKTADGQILVYSGSDVRVVDSRSDLSVRALKIQNCPKDSWLTISNFGGKLFAQLAQSGKWQEYKLAYTKNLISALELGRDTLTCSKPINVPGRVLAVTKTEVISEDQAVLDVVERVYGNDKFYSYKTKNLMTALKLEDSRAVLTDAEDREEYTQFEVVDNSTLLRLRQDTGESVSWRRTSASEPYLERMALDSEGRWVRQVHYLSLEIQGGANMVDVVDVSGEKLLVVSGPGLLQVLRMKSLEERPQIVSLVSVDTQGRRATEAKTAVSIPSRWLYGSRKVHWTESQKSLEIPMGVSGVFQVYLK